jgi:glycerophosphoryl diester phosphodiesterase
MTDTPLIIGHRGGKLPGNDLATLQWAYESHADGVEFDVFICKDGGLFVYHPEKEEKFTFPNEPGKEYDIRDCTTAQIISLRQAPGTFPTFNEVMAHLKGLAQNGANPNFIFMVEIKDYRKDFPGYQSEKLAKDVVGTIIDMGVQNQTQITCFSETVLQLVDAEMTLRNSFLPISSLYKKSEHFIEGEAKNYSCISCQSVKYDDWGDRIVKVCNANGINMALWKSTKTSVVEGPAWYDQAKSWKVRYVISDHI